MRNHLLCCDCDCFVRALADGDITSVRLRFWRHPTDRSAIVYIYMCTDCRRAMRYTTGGTLPIISTQDMRGEQTTPEDTAVSTRKSSPTAHRDPKSKTTTPNTSAIMQPSADRRGERRV